MSRTSKARIKARVGMGILSLIFPVIALVIAVVSGFGWPIGLLFAGGLWVLLASAGLAAKWVLDA